MDRDPGTTERPPRRRLPWRSRLVAVAWLVAAAGWAAAAGPALETRGVREAPMEGGRSVSAPPRLCVAWAAGRRDASGPSAPASLGDGPAPNGGRSKAKSGDGTEVGDLIAAADRAMYEAKAGGRQRIRISGKSEG